MKRRYYLLPTVCYLLIFVISGCATRESAVTHVPDIGKVRGVYHSVKKGETLWRIARAYNVDLDEVVKINRISDSSKIEAGQLIIIPGRRKKVPVRLKEENFLWPIRGNIISNFGDKIDGMINKGIDIEVKFASEIKAARSGVVTFCEDSFKGYGKTIIIEHADNFSTVYAGNSENIAKLNEKVMQGQVIAKAGMAGHFQVPHLHFEIRSLHKAKNPLYYLP